MDKRTYRLSEDKRVQRILVRAAAPVPNRTEKQIKPSECEYCGAELPRDVMFQRLHMERVHGLVV